MNKTWKRKKKKKNPLSSLMVHECGDMTFHYFIISLFIYKQKKINGDIWIRLEKGKKKILFLC